MKLLLQRDEIDINLKMYETNQTAFHFISSEKMLKLFLKKLQNEAAQLQL